MPKAGEVAIELRKLADALDKYPDSKVPSPYVVFARDYGKDDKEKFLNFAKIMPRPYEKKHTDNEYRIQYVLPAIHVASYIDRNIVCELIEPAKPAVYKCDPILSDEEESSLTEA